MDRLFAILKTEEYLKADPTAITAAEEPEAVASPSSATNAASEIPNDVKVKVKRESTPEKSKECDKTSSEGPSGGGTDTSSAVHSSGGTTVTSLSSVASSKSRHGSPKEEHKSTSGSDTRRRRISNRARSRSRSRSRSYERTRRSRSRERVRVVEPKPIRPYREQGRRYDRRPHVYGGRMARNRSQSGSRSPSPVDRRKISRSVSPNMDQDSKIPMKRQRCRDFDEKGYCMRGETCPWDHGVDPVVLEDINNPALISIQSAARVPIHSEYNPDTPDLWNRSTNFPGIRNRLGPVGQGVNGQFLPRPGGPPTGFRGPFPPFPGNPIGTTPLQRELISVPVVDANKGGDVSAAQVKRRFEPEDSVAVAETSNKRKIPLGNRLGPPRAPHPQSSIGPQQNCSLELRKIPRGLNAISHLNNHFSKFGKIVNIHISYEGDPEAAIVTFSTHAEANVAYRSTEAVLNNRFIKVFWHTPPSGGDQPSLTASAKTENPMSLRRSYPNQYSINNMKTEPVGAAAAATPVSSTTDSVTASTSTAATTTTATVNTANKLVNSPAVVNTTTPVSTASAAAANHLRLKNQKINRATTQMIRKKQEEKSKEAVQIAHGLQKRKTDILDGYFKQLRQLMTLMEKCEANDPSRTELKTMMVDVEKKIETLKKEIKEENIHIAAQIQNQPPARKTKEQQQKEILDVELDLISQEQHVRDEK